MDLFDVVCPEEGRDEKIYWNKVGVIMQWPDGGMTLKLNHLPGVSYKVFKRESKSDRNPNYTSSQSSEDAPF